MSRLKNYINSIDFLISDISTESILLKNINKKYLKEIELYKNNIFIEIENLDIVLTEKNPIVFYPYNIRFVVAKDNKIKIPIFLKSPSLLVLLLTSKKIKFKPITVNDIETDLTDKEIKYYYQERSFINMLIK